MFPFIHHGGAAVSLLRALVSTNPVVERIVTLRARRTCVASSKNTPIIERVMLRAAAAALARRGAGGATSLPGGALSHHAPHRHPSSAWTRAAGMCHDAQALGALPGESEHAVSDVDKFLFDTNGFVIVKNVFSKKDLKAFHDAIDAHAHLIHERKGQLRLTAAKTPLSGDGKTGRKDLAGFLGWDTPHADPFRSVLAHPKLVPYLHELVGPGYRLDHNPLLIMQDPGAEGFEFHGGSTLDDGNWNHPLGYDFRHGKMRCNLLAFAVHLTDVEEGDGGFAIVRGSHKSNFVCPPSIKRYETATEHSYQPAVSAGDVVIFTEATTHGTLPWKGDAQRRNLIYRFSPANMSYGRGAMDDGWPASYLDGMSDAQRCVMAPPYHPRLNRVAVRPDATGVVKPAPREKHKVDFDRAVFKSDYF